jgi:hypothetical protein
LAYFQQTLLPVLKETSKTIAIKMPDKLQAVEQLAKLCGWNEPEKFEHGTTDTLTEYLREIRSRLRM